MKKNVSFVLVLILVLSLVFTGCGSGGVISNEGGDAADGQTYTWKVQGYTAAGTYFDQMGQNLANAITEASGGRLTIEWYAADSIVAVAENANAVRDGILDGAFDYAGLYTSMNDAFALFCSSPGLFSDPFDMYTWMTKGGGLELWQEMWDDYGMNGHLILAGLHDQEDWLWSNEPIETIDDMKGITLRMMPIMGTVLADHGLSVAFISGTEIVSSMERGVIDAGEYSIPILDKTFGFQDVAKYYARPGIHQPTATVSLNINQDRWNELPDDLKRLVEACCHENVLNFWADGTVQNIEAIEYFDEIGAVQTTLTDETVDTLLQWIDEWYEKECPKNEWLAKVRESQMNHIKNVASYKDSLDFAYPDWAYEE